MKQCLQWMFAVLLAALLTGTDELCAADPQPSDTAAAASAEGEMTYSPQWPEPPNTGAMLLRLCLGTVFVLALCVGSLWLGKPWLQKLQAGASGTQALKIEGSVTLGNRAVLYLVKVGDTQLVAGTDATGLKSLLALPASFKEVLDDQLPGETDESPITAVPTNNLELRLRTATGT